MCVTTANPDAIKSAGPIGFVRNVCPESLADVIFSEPTAHAMGVSVKIHGGGKLYALEGIRRGYLPSSNARCTDIGCLRRWSCSSSATIVKVS